MFDKKVTTALGIVAVATVIAPVWIAVPLAVVSGTMIRKSVLPSFLQ